MLHFDAGVKAMMGGREAIEPESGLEIKTIVRLLPSSFSLPFSLLTIDP